MKANQLTGKTFGRLTVVERIGVSKNGHILWLCTCECGNSTVVFGSNLVRNHTLSCGCLNTEVITRHGKYATSTYQTWKGMIQRCTNPNAAKYEHYGGRGITVCKEWFSFSNFLKDMGERPDKSLTLDRIKNEKGYYRENCRWATKEQQLQNTRPRKKLSKS